MQVDVTSFSLIVSQIGQLWSLWAKVPQLQISLQQLGSFSAALQSQIYSGLTEDPSLLRKEFNQFSVQWEFKHQISSPHYPQCNGKAEATVKSMKKIIRAAWNVRF